MELAARKRPELCTVINITFSNKVYSCVGISTAINGLRPVSLGGLTGQVQFQLLVYISTSKTGVHFKLCFLLKLPRNFFRVQSSEFLFPSLLKLETLKFFAARY